MSTISSRILALPSSLSCREVAALVNTHHSYVSKVRRKKGITVPSPVPPGEALREAQKQPNFRLRHREAQARRRTYPEYPGLDPAVKSLLDLAYSNESYTLREIALKAGYTRDLLSRMRLGYCSRTANIMTIRALLNVLGHDLKVVPLSEMENEDD